MICFKVMKGKNEINNCLLLVLIFFSEPFFVFGGPGNIAPEATVTASTIKGPGFEATNVTDGIIGVENKGEWACEGQGFFWGYIRLPWIELRWEQPRTINKVILYDRPGLDLHTAGGQLQFSDGSEIPVNAIPNNGTAKKITFPSKTVDWIRFQVADGVGHELGLSEIEVFPGHEDYSDFVSWVDPFVESAKGRYFFFTPGARPFGMAAAAPVTRNKNQYGGGYNYNSLEILGFGQLHGWMISGIQIMPTSGAVDPSLGSAGWKSRFSHEGELARPGYQRVFLEKYGIWVEFTSSVRATFYRIIFTKAGFSSLLTNLGGYLGNSTMSGAKARKISNTRIEGSFDSGGRLWGGPEKIKVFFAMEFDKPFTSVDGWNENGVLKNIDEITGSVKMTRKDSASFGNVVQSYWDAPTAGLRSNYSVAPGDQLLLKIGVSYTSVENAWNNLYAEIDHWDFDKVKQESEDEWNRWLSRIEVKGGTPRQRTKFYTDLWHVLLGRRRINDINGNYPDYTQGTKNWKFTDAKLKVRQLPMTAGGQSKFNMYNSDAIWLTKWNLNILWGLAWPELLDDFSASLVQYAKNGNLLPRGPNIGGYSYIMTGNPATSMLVSTYVKGLMRKVSPKDAYEAMKRNHMPGGMMGDTPEELQFYIKNGYCPGNAGKTLEWAFQDWSLSQMAGKMGRKKDQKYFEKRSTGWKKLYREDKQLLFPKDQHGEWLHNDPLSMHGWVESNAWQGTWQASHDIPSLADLMGGNDVLTEKLNHAFEQSEKEDFVFGYGKGYVSYANQPGCSNAHVFNYAGKPWLTQFWVRKVNEQAYGDTSPNKGYGGHDEDQGQMGGVSALMSIGLFSLKGTNSQNPVYEITSPVFDEIIIHLDPYYYEGKTFRISTKNNSPENCYIHSIKLNNQSLDRLWFYHRDFQKGGDLEIELGPAPRYELGSSKKSALPKE